MRLRTRFRTWLRPWRALLVTAIAGCYNPELGPCEVTCGSDSPCPADLVCKADSYCHTPDDTSTCMPGTEVLMVSTEGNGGKITSTPAGINCIGSGGSGCLGTFTVGTAITLDAHPFGDQFIGWSGDACGSGTDTMCMFTIEMPTQVSATFQ
jgi:hypothetical protein